MAFVLPDLPYAFDALEPIIDAKTMEIHHGRHHAAYVANLNKAVENYPEWAEKSIEDVIIHLNEVPEAIRTAVRNNGGGHYNHSLFWKMMAPVGQTNRPLFFWQRSMSLSALLMNLRSSLQQLPQAVSAAAGHGSWQMAANLMSYPRPIRTARWRTVRNRFSVLMCGNMPIT